ncbi:hypothetical protein RJ639_034794 [Escallonia herrerae]|uniref:Uncharacterized protein n=1 Tax=Escallonia herrerae TaxID=1293975 RepID=A0AA88WY27_9ASTE|nr:hypothetical protein RJ639_034794 [Escallonia herrerae]
MAPVIPATQRTEKESTKSDSSGSLVGAALNRREEPDVEVVFLHFNVDHLTVSLDRGDRDFLRVPKDPDSPKAALRVNNAGARQTKEMRVRGFIFLDSKGVVSVGVMASAKIAVRDLHFMINRFFFFRIIGRIPEFSISRVVLEEEMADRAPLSNEYRLLLGPPNRPNATEQERMLTYVSNVAGGACVEIIALFQFRFEEVDQEFYYRGSGTAVGSGHYILTRKENVITDSNGDTHVRVNTNCVPAERRATVAWVDDIYELACLRLDDGLLPLPSVDFFLEDVKQGMDVVSLSALRGNRNTLKPGIICHPLRQDDAYNFEVIQHSIQLGYGASGAGLLTGEGSLCGLHYGHDHNQIMLAIPVPQLMKFFIDAVSEDVIGSPNLDRSLTFEELID